MHWYVAGLLLLAAEIVWRKYIWMSLGIGALAAGISLEYIQRAEWQALIMLLTSAVVFLIMRRVDQKWITRRNAEQTDKTHKQTSSGGTDV